MQRRLSDAGFRIVDALDDADCAVVNTCSFIRAATEESIDEILDVLNDPGVLVRGVPLVVTGCLPARYGDDLAAEMPEVASFVPCAGEEDIVAAVTMALLDSPARADAPSVERVDARPAALPFSYVKISDGCDRFCSYCTIPFIRGRYRSFSLEDIIADVDAKVADGAKEIVLIAQDTGRWGTDLPEPSSLAMLVSTLAERHPRIWFRMMYIQPEGIDDALLAAMRDHDNVCDYLDVPIQHVDSGILASMNRSGSAEGFVRLVERIRAVLPDATLRTTLIVGFPGETEERFDELEAFVSEGHFDLVGVFPYSREEGTRAFDLPDQIDEEEKAYRADRIRAVADAVSAAKVAERIGTVCAVLVEGIEEDGQRYGRTRAQAPEVDGVTFVDRGEPGSIVEALIEDSLLYDMEGSVCAEGTSR